MGYHRNFLLIVQHEMFMLLTFVIIAIGIPSYIDVGGIFRIIFHLFLVAPILCSARSMWIVFCELKDIYGRSKWMEFLGHLLLLFCFVAVCCVILVGVQTHEYNWQYLTQAWTDLKSNNKSDAMFSYQMTFNCCGFMDPLEYVFMNVTLPESCLTDHSIAKESCYKVFRDADFVYYAIIVGILCVYIVIKHLSDYIKWRMSRDISAGTQRQSISEALVSN